MYILNAVVYIKRKLTIAKPTQSSSKAHGSRTSFTTMPVSNSSLSHPLDPLSSAEIRTAISIVREANQDVNFNVVSLQEPRKAAMTKWLESRSPTTKPPRIADVTTISPGGKVGDGLVDISSGKIVKWEWVDGMQPIVRQSKYPVNEGSKLTFTFRSRWRSCKPLNMSYVLILRSLSSAKLVAFPKARCIKSTVIHGLLDMTSDSAATSDCSKL